MEHLPANVVGYVHRIGFGRSGTSARSRRGRRGLTLLEILVAVAVMLMLTIAVLPAMSTMLLLEQRGAARDIALAYERLHDEAILRNRTFRLAFDVDAGTWHVEAAGMDATIFSNAEARQFAEEQEAAKLEEMEPEDRRRYLEKQAFQKVDGHDLSNEYRLPANTRFKSVYTPQYAEAVRPRQAGDKDRGKDDKKGPRVAYSYIFANGFAEYTVIQLVSDDDPTEGFTIVVDPLSGQVTMHSELVDRHDAWSFLPDEGPRLDL